MLPEKDTNPSERYLLCNAMFPDKLLVTIKSDVQKFMRSREKDVRYHHFMNWTRQENEIAVLTLYAYADIPLPRQYDLIFQIGQPDNYVIIDYTITQAVINGWTTVDQLDHGHKHIAIVQFPEGIPSIIDLLPPFSTKQAAQKGNQLGFCTTTDFAFIRNKTLLP